MTTKEIEQAFDISNMLPNKVLKDDTEILKHIKHCVGISKAFTDSFMVDRKVIDDIKADIEEKISHYEHFSSSNTANGLNMALQIIDKHIGGDADE